MDPQFNFLQEKCREIVTKNMKIFHPISDIKVITPSLAGEHMASACYHATVEFEKHESVQFFIKVKLKDGKTKEFVDQMEAFPTEGKFLTEFLSEMKTFCQTKTDKIQHELVQQLSSIFPETYYVDDDTIIMENAIPKGYECLDKLKKQDFQFARYVKGLIHQN